MNIIQTTVNMMNAAARASGVSAKALQGRRRTHRLVLVRWAVWSAMIELGMTHEEIARAFRRDRGTVSHAFRASQGLAGLDKQTFDDAKAAAKSTLKQSP